MQYQISSPQVLFDQLNELVKNNEAFYITEQTFDGNRYFIYNYRLCAYSDWLTPGAFNARGTMFQVDKNGEYVKLVSLPFHKFFNAEENPFVMNLDYALLDYVVDKVDGSLISTFMHNNEMKLKTKGSLFSDQAIAATRLLNTPAYDKLKALLADFTVKGYTVNLEYTAPDNRIVIGYLEPKLTVLGVRSNICGTYVCMRLVQEIFAGFVVKDHTSVVGDNINGFLTEIPAMTGIEGFIIRLLNGTMVKIKTAAYVSLHHAKDSINLPRRLFECVVNESADDLRSLFHDDPLALAQIDEMQEKVSKIYNHLVNEVETFHKANKELDRKSFAIKGQAELDRKYFSIAMLLYQGREVNYKEFLIKNYKEFGIKDEEPKIEE